MQRTAPITAAFRPRWALFGTPLWYKGTGEEGKFTGNRSHRGQQGRRVLSAVVGLNRGEEPGKDVAALATAGFDHREQTLDELTARRGLRAKRQLTPDHGMTQRLL